ncbi:MAG: serine/threonine-protein kinase [Planctomycetaceae bacterium]
MDLQGAILGRYRLGRQLGRGGMGVVYRAETLEAGPAGAAGAAVAIKIFHPHLVSDETAFKRFQLEAQIGIEIRHPNVVRTFEIASAEAGGTRCHFMAMEYVEGQNLRALLADLGSLPDELLRHIADQVLDGLSAVHARNVVHRDLKPENIVITRENRVLLMDLGVARLQQDGPALTRAGEFVGSLPYAAPEQFVDLSAVGPLTDIYGFGVVLYELATGRNPFEGGDLNTVLQQKLQGTVRRPKHVLRGIDPFLDEVIVSCLRREGAERPQSSAALRTILSEGTAGAWWKGRTDGLAYPAAESALRKLEAGAETPLQGRDAELASLHDAFAKAQAGQGSTAFVTGSAGSGTTRLLHAFLQDLVGPDGPVLLAGRCGGDEASPLEPFLDAARDLFRAELQGGAAAPGLIEERLRAYVPELEGLLPHLARLLACGSDSDGNASRDSLAPAFASLLRRIASQTPLVLVLDDLHLARAETLEMLSFLGRGLSGHRILFVASVRPEEVEEGTPLSTLLLESGRKAESSLTLPLAPLGRSACDAILRGATRNERTVRALGRALHRRSDGSPGFLLDLIAQMKSDGALRESAEGFVAGEGAAEPELPSDARDALALRLQRLDATQRATLEAAAVQGPEFDSSLLGAVLEERKIRLLQRLALLERKHQMIRSAGKEGFRFTSHALYASVYSGIDPARRAELHGRLAAAILEAREGEAAPAGRTAFLLVQHLLRAGRPGEAEAYAESAIRHVASSHHPDDARPFLEALREGLGGGSPLLRFQIAIARWTVHEMAGLAAAQFADLEEAGAIAETDGSAGLKAQHRRRLAATFWRTGDYARASEEAEAALVLAAEAGDREEEASAVEILGAVSQRRGLFARAASAARKALAIRKECGDRRGEARCLIALAAALPEVGMGKEAPQAREDALALFREMGDRRGESRTLDGLGNTLVEMNRLEEAIGRYDEAIAISREIGDLPGEAAPLHHRGRALAVLGRIDEAKTSLQRAIDIYAEIGDPGAQAAALTDLGAAISVFEVPEKAQACYEAAIQAGERTGDEATLARAHRLLGRLLHGNGERARAWTHLQRAYDLAASLGALRSRAGALIAMGGAALEEGEFDRAAALLQDALRDERAGQEVGSRPILTLCRLARAHMGAGRRDKAHEAAVGAEQLLESHAGLPLDDGPEIYYSLGQVLPEKDRGRRYLTLAHQFVAERTRAIRSVIHREHFLTRTYPNAEILEAARRITQM